MYLSYDYFFFIFVTGSTSLFFGLDCITEYSSAQNITVSTEFYNQNGQWEHSGDYSEIEEYRYVNESISARVNTYTLNEFSLETVICLKEGNINGNAVKIGTLKYSITINNYVFESDDAKLRICVEIKVNGVQEELTGEYVDAYEFTLGPKSNQFRLINEKSASCTDSDGNESKIDVVPERDGGSLCYTFDRCDGTLFYDPFVYYEGKAHLSMHVIDEVLFLCCLCVYR